MAHLLRLTPAMQFVWPNLAYLVLFGAAVSGACAPASHRDPESPAQSQEPVQAEEDASTAHQPPTRDAPSKPMRGNPDGPAACENAGGRCVLGSFQNCAERVNHDCNPQLNPGGAFCCLKDGPPKERDAGMVAAGSSGSAGKPAIDDADGGTSRETVDYSCTVDADCIVKDVGNCCGAYPRCVNKDSGTPPPYCPPGFYSVCGFPVIESCACRQNTCRSLQGTKGDLSFP